VLAVGLWHFECACNIKLCDYDTHKLVCQQA
jgi:hypothetical protein